MVYDLSIKKLEDIFTRMMPSCHFMIKRDENNFTIKRNKNENGNENKNLILDEASYFEACYFLKLEGTPKEFPEVKKAENLYRKGEIYEASKLLNNLYLEIENLRSISEKDIRYYGN
ncbi:MAG: hypothetical protein Q8Q04_00600 [archaeon]|nr:hypothetical protein [archaeon]